jgi:hypothetical protein
VRAAHRWLVRGVGVAGRGRCRGGLVQCRLAGGRGPSCGRTAVALLDASTACLSSQQRRHHVGVHDAPWLWLLRGDGVDGGVGDLASPPVRGAPGAARRLPSPMWRQVQSCACAGAEAHDDLLECVGVHGFSFLRWWWCSRVVAAPTASGTVVPLGLVVDWSWPSN